MASNAENVSIWWRQHDRFCEYIPKRLETPKQWQQCKTMGNSKVAIIWSRTIASHILWNITLIYSHASPFPISSLIKAIMLNFAFPQIMATQKCCGRWRTEDKRFRLASKWRHISWNHTSCSQHHSWLPTWIAKDAPSLLANTTNGTGITFERRTYHRRMMM